MNEKKLFLLDGHALVYRAHYAFINRPLINSKGLNTSAITGFMNSLWNIMTSQKPTHIAVSFDMSGPTFRHEMFPEYKANREAQPEDITAAIPHIKDLIKGLNIPIVTLAGYEADDLIGTIAKQAEKEDFKVYMVTPDKDYAQLVSDNIFMYKPARMGNGIEILGPEEVKEKWGIKRVDQVIDVLALQGDSVDNIPGIPGVGPKTAVKLLAQFDDLEGILANTDQLKGKQKEKIENNAEQGRMSKVLATINIECPVTFDADAYEYKGMHADVLREKFDFLEFSSLARKILKSIDGNVPPKATTAKTTTTKSSNPAPTSQGSLFDVGTTATPASTRANISTVQHDYKLVNTDEAINELITTLSTYSHICFDTETTGLDANNVELVGIAFSVEAHKAFYVPIDADQEIAKAQVAKFKPLFDKTDITFIGQNLKYDLLVLKWYDLEVKGPLFDTMIAHYLTNPELKHNLTYLSETYLDYSPVEISSLIGSKGSKQGSMRNVALDKITEYAGEDADLTFQLYQHLSKELEAPHLQKLYTEIEAPLIKVLTTMEYNGVHVDGDFLSEYSKILGEEATTIADEIFAIAGAPFNIDSPKQVGEVLFDRLKLPYKGRKTKTGQYSTSEDKLKELAEEHDIVSKILAFRSLTKLKSTYADALSKIVNPKSKRVHTQFNQALTATGRLSSSNPNLQNIPIKTEAGRKIRKAFIPRDENHVLIAADYSQIELRLIAEMSQDKNMLEAFQNNQDIHTATAAKVYGVAIDEVNPTQRRNAKTVNFSIIYGAGATNLSKNLDIPRTEAKALIDTYFEQYSGLKKYMDETKTSAQENGYVETMLGRRRYLRDINSRNGMLRSHAERNAVNSPIQGTAADMIKIAMINVQEQLISQGLQTKMILQVHDELIFDVPKSEIDVLKVIIDKEMKTALPNISVPIEIGTGIGNDWLEAH